MILTLSQFLLCAGTIPDFFRFLLCAEQIFDFCLCETNMIVGGLEVVSRGTKKTHFSLSQSGSRAKCCSQYSKFNLGEYFMSAFPVFNIKNPQTGH